MITILDPFFRLEEIAMTTSNEQFFNLTSYFRPPWIVRAIGVWFQRGYITLVHLKMATVDYGNSLCVTVHIHGPPKSSYSWSRWKTSREQENVSHVPSIPAQLLSSSKARPALWNTRSKEFARRAWVLCDLGTWSRPLLQKAIFISACYFLAFLLPGRKWW